MLVKQLEELQDSAYAWENLSDEQQDIAEGVYARYVDATTPEEDRSGDHRGGVYRLRTEEDPAAGYIVYQYHFASSQLDEAERQSLDAVSRAFRESDEKLLGEKLKEEAKLLFQQRLKDMERYPHYYVSPDEPREIVRSTSQPPAGCDSCIRMGDIDVTLAGMGNALTSTRNAWSQLQFVNLLAVQGAAVEETPGETVYAAYSKLRAGSNAAGGGNS